ncbi:hypothetical protein Tco_0290533 [Tanacetum coccineum]
MEAVSNNTCLIELRCSLDEELTCHERMKLVKSLGDVTRGLLRMLDCMFHQGYPSHMSLLDIWSGGMRQLMRKKAYIEKGLPFCFGVGSFFMYAVRPDVELPSKQPWFCDASWQCDKDGLEVQSGYVFIVNGRSSRIGRAKKQHNHCNCMQTSILSTWFCVRSAIGSRLELIVLGIGFSYKPNFGFAGDNIVSNLILVVGLEFTKVLVFKEILWLYEYYLEMAHSENNTLSSAFKTFFERETLTGPNFNEWHSDVACIMLGKMSPALQRQFENYPPQNMLAELRKMFEKPPAVEIYDLVDASYHDLQTGPCPLNKVLVIFVRKLFNMHLRGADPFTRATCTASLTLKRGFKVERKLSYGVQYLQVGNETQAAVEAIEGCEAYVKRDSADKLQQRSVKCIFVGYPKETMGYYYLIFLSTLKTKSERTKRAPNRLCLNMEVEDDEVGDLGELANYKTAMLDPDKVIW